ncbi:MAG: hypothetical protein C0481_01200 [Phenylobacterium sp.]|uniref:hypothetical protein n=1 Tax=Phenylobacterium sp. TaxID=1871053 RepID=UPI0025DC9ED3|nr:hypothetical protein [Phenylobacterium sp.]MBA4010457.1 hypothetical protein [Phenylobacterium sp.]
MAFQPFGYAVDIRSQMTPRAVRSAIRRRWRGWFDPIDGSRGWMIGPFICLWRSALDSRGPILLAVISSDGFGSRISGRAGSDLNGIALMVLLGPAILISMIGAVQAGQGTTTWAVGWGIVLMLGLGLTLWWGHADRREAEPLVRFLTDVVTVSGQSARMSRLLEDAAIDITLDVDGHRRKGPVTAATLYDHLLEMADGGVLILERRSEVCMQATARDGGFALEKREGGRREHFRAVRSGMPPGGGDRLLFSFEEAVDACLDYAEGGAVPSTVGWEPMKP